MDTTKLELGETEWEIKIPHHYSDRKELELIYAEYQHTILPFTYQYGEVADIRECQPCLPKTSR